MESEEQEAVQEGVQEANVPMMAHNNTDIPRETPPSKSFRWAQKFTGMSIIRI